MSPWKYGYMGVGLFVSVVIFCIAGSLVALDSSKPKLPPPKNGGVYVIAHRGFHKGYPENTLIAYKKAIEVGVDFVEMDLRTTKDGQIVSIHNSKVDEYVRDFKGAVSSFTLSELKEMDIGSRIGSEFADERIPTLEEILDVVNGRVGLYIDMKDADPARVLEALDKYGMRYNVVWYGGPATLEKIRSLCPDCFIMPDPGQIKHLEYVLNRFDPPIISTDLEFCSEEFVRVCHRKGVMVFMDMLGGSVGPEDWEKALKWGINGIQTDDPDLLVQYLREKQNKVESK